MEELLAVPGGQACATDQVLYNLTRRGTEWDLLPWCRDKGIPVMAYSPIEQGRIPAKGALQSIADRHGRHAVPGGLAWVLAQEGVIAIPKASDPDHVKANRAAADLTLTPEDLAALDKAFPAAQGTAPAGNALSLRRRDNHAVGAVFSIACRHSGKAGCGNGHG